jgi:hypothetical protein
MSSFATSASSRSSYPRHKIITNNVQPAILALGFLAFADKDTFTGDVVAG